MFFNLNITDYIVYHMKKEFLSSVIFVTFVFGVNYILTHVLNEYSNENTNKDNERKQGESEIQMEDFENIPNENKQDQNKHDENKQDQNTLENTLENTPNENTLDENTQDENTLENTLENTQMQILDSVKNVIENEIKDDILTIQKILERKKYLLNLNDRLSEIKLKLQELQNELSRS